MLLAGYASVTPAHAETWIDVRSAEEYAAGHVPQAINIPHDEIGERIAALDLAYDQPFLLYCRSGRRSGLARETLSSMGFTELTNVGGLEDAEKLSKSMAEQIKSD